MKKVIVYIFRLAALAALFGIFIALASYALGYIPNLFLIGLKSHGVETEFLTSSGSAIGWLISAIVWFCGASLYLLCGVALNMFLVALARIIEVGWKQYRVETKEQAAEEIKAAVIDAGEVVAITIDRGGFLDSTQSTVETSKGFYRVFGSVGSVSKGAKVVIEKDRLGPFKMNQLCVDGKKYKITN